MKKLSDQTDLSQLWIGDHLVHLPTGVIGTYEGLVQGRIKFKVSSNLMEAGMEDFALVTEQVEEKGSELDTFVEATGSGFEDLEILDLHMDKLDPSRAQDQPIVIRTYQMRRCQEFLELATAKKRREITIVHGRGEGVLEADVLNLIDKYIEVERLEKIHNGGAHRIWFKY